MAEDPLEALTRQAGGIRKQIEADTLAYLSIEALREIEASMKHGFCDACFSGDYPIPITDPDEGDAQLPLFEDPEE